MKPYSFLLLAVFALLGLSSRVTAQSATYASAMKSGLDQGKAAKTAPALSDVANYFERIASAEKTQWLPAYYAAFYNFLTATMNMSTPKDCDLYLDKAAADIALASSVKKDESEILALKGQINYMKLSVDPMGRYMTVLPLARAELDSAQTLNPANPRVDFIRGQQLYYTPEQYGGGKATAKPFLQSALDKFGKFKPESDLSPAWGLERCKLLLEQAGK